MAGLIFLILMSRIFFSTGNVEFYVNTSRYLDDSSITWEEIYVSIPSNENFENLDFKFQIEDLDGVILHADSWQIDIPTSTQQYSAIEKFSFDLSGNYKITISLEDKYTNKGVVTYYTEPLEEGTLISDILFISSASQTEETGDFIKGGLFIYPDFDITISFENKELFAYYELYPSTEDDSLEVLFLLKDELGHLQWSYQSTSSYDVENGYVGKIINIPVDNLANGEYKLIVRTPKREIEEDFIVNWNINENQIPELIMSPLAKKYYKELDYLLSVEQVKFFETLSDTGKEEFYKIFWNSLDPNPVTEENEYLEMYSQKMLFADENFSSGFERGINSDRGRIYILKGPPDEIHEIPADVKYVPNIIWVYWNNGRKYIFADVNLHGNFELIYSNDPDEVNRPGWERYTDESFGDIW